MQRCKHCNNQSLRDFWICYLVRDWRANAASVVALSPLIICLGEFQKCYCGCFARYRMSVRQAGIVDNVQPVHDPSAEDPEALIQYLYVI